MNDNNDMKILYGKNYWNVILFISEFNELMQKYGGDALDGMDSLSLKIEKDKSLQWIPHYPLIVEIVEGMIEKRINIW